MWYTYSSNGIVQWFIVSATKGHVYDIACLAMSRHPFDGCNDTSKTTRTFGIQSLQGHDFDTGSDTDHSNIVIQSANNARATAMYKKEARTENQKTTVSTFRDTVKLSTTNTLTRFHVHDHLVPKRRD